MRIEPLFRLECLTDFVPPSTAQWSDETLRSVTRNLLKADLATVERVQRELAALPSDKFVTSENAHIPILLPQLQDQYGSQDPGSLVALLCMNYMELEAGDAIYIPADGIHAYLSGDIVECMARSNNVLNVGFCPAIDRDNIDLFANTLTFQAHSKEDMVLPSQMYTKSKTGKTVVYRPPIREFDMLKTDLQAGEFDEVGPHEGPGVLIVTQGQGKMEADGEHFELKKGYIYFVAPNVTLLWTTSSTLQVHMAVI